MFQFHTWVRTRHLEFNVDSEWQTFEKFFMTILITLRVFAKFLLRGCCRINIPFFISFCWRYLTNTLSISLWWLLFTKYFQFDFGVLTYRIFSRWENKILDFPRRYWWICFFRNHRKYRVRQIHFFLENALKKAT